MSLFSKSLFSRDACFWVSWTNEGDFQICFMKRICPSLLLIHTYYIYYYSCYTCYSILKYHILFQTKYNPYSYLLFNTCYTCSTCFFLQKSKSNSAGFFVSMASSFSAQPVWKAIVCTNTSWLPGRHAEGQPKSAAALFWSEHVL